MSEWRDIIGVGPVIAQMFMEEATRVNRKAWAALKPTVADPDKKAARKRQRKARAKTRKMA